jgi:hypothetical protein
LWLVEFFVVVFAGLLVAIKEPKWLCGGGGCGGGQSIALLVIPLFDSLDWTSLFQLIENIDLRI